MHLVSEMVAEISKTLIISIYHRFPESPFYLKKPIDLGIYSNKLFLMFQFHLT